VGGLRLAVQGLVGGHPAYFVLGVRFVVAPCSIFNGHALNLGTVFINDDHRIALPIVIVGIFLCDNRRMSLGIYGGREVLPFLYPVGRVAVAEVARPVS
jgi:hypothetical protein